MRLVAGAYYYYFSSPSLFFLPASGGEIADDEKALLFDTNNFGTYLFKKYDNYDIVGVAIMNVISTPVISCAVAVLFQIDTGNIYIDITARCWLLSMSTNCCSVNGIAGIKFNKNFL